MKLGQVIGQVNWVDMELIASLFLLYRKNGGIISSSMSGFLEYCYWIFQILKINKFNKVLLVYFIFISDSGHLVMNAEYHAWGHQML